MLGEIVDGVFTEPTGRGGRGLPSVPHSEEHRDIAYEVWRTDGGQNTTLTASLLSDQHGITIPYRTLARWVQVENWSRRSHLDRLKRMSSQVAEDTALNLHEAANHASRYLLDLTSGKVAVPDRWLIKAAEVALDRAGYGPSRPDHAPRLVHNDDRTVIDLDAMTDDQLAELAAGTLNRE